MSTRRRLSLAFAAAGVMLGSLVAPTVAQAAPTEPAAYSASGKTAPDGRPRPHAAARGAHTAVTPSAADTQALPTPECPPVLMAKCRFVPAAYEQVDPADPSNYGNYDIANRPAGGLKITSIVEHVTEGSCADTLAAFRNPQWYASSHYVICNDIVYQMVKTKDVAWHAGNWYLNSISIGVELVGFAAEGRTWFTPEMYLTSALLNQWLTQRFQIPLDRQHILGHENVPAPVPALMAGMHWEPGPFWNWQYFMSLMGAPVLPSAGPQSPLVTMAPNWWINQPAVTDCRSGTCIQLPKQPANFIYLRQAPSDTAPLLSDVALHPDGSPGTTRIDDWSAKAVYGQQFAVAGRQGSWVAIWFGGQKGWFKNPAGVLNALPTRGQLVKPRAGLASIPVYGRAYPEASAYNGTAVPVQAVVPLQYNIAAGQAYATTGLVPTEYYYSWTIDDSAADDDTLIVGNVRYFQIQLGHRVAYVKQSDVELVG